MIKKIMTGMKGKDLFFTQVTLQILINIVKAFQESHDSLQILF